MTRTITIATAHSKNHPEQTMTIELEGGSPYFAYIWVNDILYQISGYDNPHEDPHGFCPYVKEYIEDCEEVEGDNRGLKIQQHE